VPAPGPPTALGRAASAAGTTNRSAGRFPDGVDTDSNCTDFLRAGRHEPSGRFSRRRDQHQSRQRGRLCRGQTIMIDTGENLETAVIATVGTAGATTAGAATGVGATVIPVANVIGFSGPDHHH
jgi:hypothetical protein